MSADGIRLLDSRHDWYWNGYRYGIRTAYAQTERALRLELQTATTDRHRAWALGELRGYRQATDRP